jgi:hypothetical protein
VQNFENQVNARIVVKLSRTSCGEDSGTSPLAGIVTLGDQHFAPSPIPYFGEIERHEDASKRVDFLRHGSLKRHFGFLWPTTRQDFGCASPYYRIIMFQGSKYSLLCSGQLVLS